MNGCYVNTPKQSKQPLKTVSGTRGILTRVHIVRPPGASNNTIQHGMKLYAQQDGTIEARLRAPKDRRPVIGVIITTEPNLPPLIQMTV
jgi:hypothetical protein